MCYGSGKGACESWGSLEERRKIISLRHFLVGLMSLDPVGPLFFSQLCGDFLEGPLATWDPSQCLFGQPLGAAAAQVPARPPRKLGGLLVWSLGLGRAFLAVEWRMDGSSVL